MMKPTFLLVLALLTCDAQAQQRTVYGPDGKVTGRIQPTAKAHDDLRRRWPVTGRTSTDSQGTTTIYGADGRKAGTVTRRASDDDRSNMDAVNRCRHRAGDDDADGGRTCAGRCRYPRSALTVANVNRTAPLT